MANKRGLGRGIDALFSDEEDKKEAQVVEKVAPKKMIEIPFRQFLFLR